MKCKLQSLINAIDFLRYTSGVKLENGEVEIRSREENFEEGKVMDCVTLIATYQKEPAQYDTWKSAKSIKCTIEIYPDSEGRPPRVTTEESQDLIKRD